ncbi:hypothetical protein, partial [Methylophaga sp.]
PDFGNISGILQDMYLWVHDHNKLLSETCTYEIEDGEDELKAYCFDIVRNNTDDYLVVLWNETATNDGRVVTVNGNQTVGDADVNFTDIPEGSIPGYASYFWFIPERNIFASIRFHHSLLIGKSALDRYFKEFSAKFTSNVVVEENEEGAEIIGYTDIDGEVNKLSADFKSFLYRKPGQIEYIQENRDSIRKVIRKNELKPQRIIQREFWQKLLESLGAYNEQQSLSEDVKIKYEVPLCPTEGQLNSIIDEWASSNNESKWDDVGFLFDGEGNRVRWLSNSIAKGELELDVQRENDEIVESDSLLNALSQVRAVALRLVD